MITNTTFSAFIIWKASQNYLLTFNDQKLRGLHDTLLSKLSMSLTSITFAQQCAEPRNTSSLGRANSLLHICIALCSLQCIHTMQQHNMPHQQGQVCPLHFLLGRCIFLFPYSSGLHGRLRCFKESLAPHMTSLICCSKEVLT